MSIGSDPNQHHKRRQSRIFFALGYGFLFAMALLSSVDSSIVYILLGAATFCIFLGFYHRPSIPRAQGWSSAQRPQDQSRSRTVPATGILMQLINMVRQRQSRTSTPGTASGKPRKSVLAFIPVVVIIFMIGVVISMITSGNDNGDASNYFYMAQTQSDIGQYDSAQLYFRKALRIDPEYNEAKLGYGKVFLQNNQLDSALYFFDQVIADDPDNVEAVYNKGLVYTEQKKYKEGIELIAPHRAGRRKAKTQDGRKLRRYKRRWKVERFFAWLFNYKRCIVRHEYKTENFKAILLLASTMIFLKSYFHL